MAATIEGNVAFVTGGTRGLGLSLARALAGTGAGVAVIGRDAAAGSVAAASIGSGAVAVSADVTDEVAMQAAATTAEAALGPIDILVCVAGVGSPRSPVWEADAAAYRACFDVNVFGVVTTMRAVMPDMVARGRGRVVVIGGSYGHKGAAGFGLYAASKWALRGLVRSAALDAAPHGVTVNMVSPGGVDGERLRRLFGKTAAHNNEPPEAPLARFVKSSALGRLVGEDDVAAAVLHLLGPGGRMMTGQDMIVDAGTIV